MRVLWGLWASLFLVFGCAEKVTLTGPGASDAATADVRPATCGMGLGDCDPVLGTGCPSDQRCEIAASPTRGVCIPAGTDGVGENCTAGGAQCSPGLVCAFSKCLKLCCEFADDAPCQTGPHGSTRSFCAVRFTTGSPVMGCTIPGECNWLTQEGCSTGQACRITSGRGEARCISEGAGRQGERCTDAADCSRGLICTGSSPSTATCKRACDVRNPSCGGSLSCTAQIGNNIPYNYGACE